MARVGVYSSKCSSLGHLYHWIEIKWMYLAILQFQSKTKSTIHNLKFLQSWDEQAKDR